MALVLIGCLQVLIGCLDVGEDGIGGNATLVVSVSGHEDVPGIQGIQEGNKCASVWPSAETPSCSAQSITIYGSPNKPFNTHSSKTNPSMPYTDPQLFRTIQ
jgi:hypothetical protein